VYRLESLLTDDGQGFAVLSSYWTCTPVVNVCRQHLGP
jgi:hypothetical protein